MQRPPVSVTTTWQQVAPKVRKDPRFQALDAQERRLLFESYKEGLLQVWDCLYAFACACSVLECALSVPACGCICLQRKPSC